MHPTTLINGLHSHVNRGTIDPSPSTGLDPLRMKDQQDPHGKRPHSTGRPSLRQDFDHTQDGRRGRRPQPRSIQRPTASHEENRLWMQDQRLSLTSVGDRYRIATARKSSFTPQSARSRRRRKLSTSRDFVVVARGRCSSRRWRLNADTRARSSRRGGLRRRYTMTPTPGRAASR